MDNKDDENNKLFDEIDDEEEIKEDIVIENDEENDNEVKNKNDQILNTYDKFLIDSVAINGFENKNEYHYILKNQMVTKLYFFKLSVAQKRTFCAIMRT